MKLQNLQIQFHGKDHLEHRITYVNENGTQCRDTLCSGVEFAQHVIDCLESPPRLREERDVLISMRNDLETLIKGNDHWKGNNFDSVTHLIEIANERNALRESHSMIATALQIDSTKPSDILKAIADVKSLLARPDATQPQLSEIRYVLHGDIQPCSVLYSDDTTTLLRLDEGDVMCETDTIEWSDSVTYRCQELLADAMGVHGRAVNQRALHALAQLVRDERILLNDDDNAVVQPCVECNHIFDAQSMTCPMCNTIRSSEWTDNNSPTPLR